MTQGHRDELERALRRARSPLGSLLDWEIAGRLALELGDAEAAAFFEEGARLSLESGARPHTKWLRAGNMLMLAGDRGRATDLLGRVAALPEAPPDVRLSALLILGDRDGCLALADTIDDRLPPRLVLGVDLLRARRDGDPGGEQAAVDRLRKVAAAEPVGSSNAHPNERDVLRYLVDGADGPTRTGEPAATPAITPELLHHVDVRGRVAGWWGDYAIVDAGTEVLLLESNTGQIAYRLTVTDEPAPSWERDALVLAGRSHVLALRNGAAGLSATRFPLRFGTFSPDRSIAIQLGDPAVVDSTGRGVELPSHDQHLLPVASATADEVAYATSDGRIAIAGVHDARPQLQQTFSVADPDDADELLGVVPAAFTQDGDHLLTIAETASFVATVSRTGDVVDLTVLGIDDIASVVAHPSGHGFAAIASSGWVEIVSDGTHAQWGAHDEVLNAEFDRSGRVLAVTTPSRAVLLDTLARPIELGSPATSIALDPSGGRVAAATATGVDVHRLPD